jgi:hypothetical protein
MLLLKHNSILFDILLKTTISYFKLFSKLFNKYTKIINQNI